MSTPLLENILNQPAALQEVGRHHFGAGRNSLGRAAALMASGKRVIVSGMGASFFACQAFAYELSALGHSVLTAESSELLYFLTSQIDANTVVLLISRSGESVEVTKLLPEIRKRRASLLGLTNVPDSSLSREADVSILMASPPDELVAIQTYVATVATLALLTAERNGDLALAVRELEQTAALFSHWIPECVEARTQWTPFLSSGTALYLLGRGPASGSTAEAALLMHEAGKSSAVSMSVAQFRHGPVEVVDSSFRAIVWGTQPATAALDAALASDLVRMGAEVRWIGPPLSGFELPALCSWPAVIPPRFRSIAEIIPLQVAAYRRAEIIGVRPGAFRWAPAITASETGFPVPADK